MPKADDVPDGFKQTEVGLIPNEWGVAKLSSVAETKSGGTPSRIKKQYFDGDILWVKSGELDNNIIHNTEEKITQEGLESSSARIFPSGTLLIALYGATVGKTAMLDHEAATNQAVCAIFPKDNFLHPSFLQYYFISIRPQLLLARYGGAQPNISQTIIKDTTLILPPLPEQRAIAHVLSKIQAAAEIQAKIAERARELKRALMAKLFTEGLRGEPLKETEIGMMPEGWESSSLSECITQAQYGLSVRGEVSGKYPILRMTNQREGRIVSTNLQYVNIEEGEMLKFKVNRGDLLFNRTNSLELVGRTALFDLNNDFVFASYLIRLAVDQRRLVPQFLNHYLNDETTQTRLKGLATRGVSQSNISASRLRTFVIPIPSLDEQNEIAHILQIVDAKIEAAERKRAMLDELFRAMLGQLMTGRVRTTGLMKQHLV